MQSDKLVWKLSTIIEIKLKLDESTKKKLHATTVKNLLILNDTSSMYSIEKQKVFATTVKNDLILNDTSSKCSIKKQKVFVTTVKNLLILNTTSSMYSIKPRAALCQTCVCVLYLYEPLMHTTPRWVKNKIKQLHTFRQYPYYAK